MKKRLFTIFSFIFLFSLVTSTFVKGADINFTENYRMYEMINLSGSKGIEISGKNNIDFSKADSNADVLNGIFTGNYAIKSTDAKAVNLGFTFTSSLNDLSKFSLKLENQDLKYSFKFLPNKFLTPTGDSFYGDIVKDLTVASYEPVNFKKDSNGLLRLFKLESKDNEKLVYEISITYDAKNSKVFATGGKSITTADDKQNKVMKIVHELGGTYKNPTLYVVGDNVVVNTRTLVNGKEISAGYTETIDKKTVPVMNYMKETFLTGVPENIKQKLTDENIFELFAENFDKILGGVSKDSAGLLNSNTLKQVMVIANDIPIDKTARTVEVKYPVFAGVTTVNDTRLLKLNTEIAPLETFDKFSGVEYSITGNDIYKFVVSSDAEYKTKDGISTISIPKISNKLIGSLMYKESYLKGVSKLEPNKYTPIFLIIFGILQVVGVIYLKGTLLKPKKVKKISR